jgi:hypothetical protein
MTQPILQARQVVALNIPLKRGLRVHYTELRQRYENARQLPY